MSIQSKYKYLGWKYWNEEVNPPFPDSPKRYKVALVVLATLLSLIIVTCVFVRHVIQNPVHAQEVTLEVYGPEQPPFNPCSLNSVICPGERTTMTVEASAYTSTVAQTDSTPCISADGTDICQAHSNGETICAANFVPIGTILHINGLQGGWVHPFTCIVRDRMNSRYQNHVDFYFGTGGEALSQALKFGRQEITISY